MAVYGYDRYGAPATYGGATFAASGFNLSPISIQEQGYGTVTLRWTSPDVGSSWSRIRLIRNQTGFPISETDGTVAREILSTAPSATHTDFGLTQGTHYYYGFFVETDVPAYSVTTTYNKGQVAKSVGGITYVSVVDGNVGNAQTMTAFWAVTNLTKRWVLAGIATILTTKRYEHTTRLYTNLPPYYRGKEPDWVEPAEVDKTVMALSSYPGLAKFIAIFGWGLDGIQTKYENIARIQNPEWTPAWYLGALSAHLGQDLETAASSRLQRMRLNNAPLLARSRGTRTGIQDEITASLGYDAVVTVGINKMLSWDQADAYYPLWDLWDAAGSYAIGDVVQFGINSYRATVANRGAAQGPPNGGTNTWWTQNSWYESFSGSASVLLNTRYNSRAGWQSSIPLSTAVSVITGASSPLDSSQGNAFLVTNVAGAGLTDQYVRLADRFYVRAWNAGVQYLTGHLVSSGGVTWEAVTNNLAITPGTDTKTWRTFLPFVSGASSDPQAIYENGLPCTAGVQNTFSFYVTSVTGMTSNIECYLEYYNAAGVYLSSSVANATTAITGSWVRKSVTSTAPANARFAIPILHTSLGISAGAKWMFRSVQWEASATATTWVPPRRAEVLVKPDRVNQITNPNFETNATGWTPAGAGVTFARDTTQFRTGLASGKWVAGTAGTANGEVSFAMPNDSVVTGDIVTLSTYLRNSVGTNVVLLQLRWLTNAGATVGADVVGTLGATLDTVWRRQSLTATVPATATKFTLYVIKPAAAALNDAWFIDDVLVEKSSVLSDYFDGSTTTMEHFWAGTANASKSFYYQGFAQKRYRLGDIIKRSIPHGVPFTTRYADV